uniref:Uncharacterized protein n=1 Tax=Anopheles quadriannulatus TaxID=34691 RepID=A0A182XQP9_ANOQN
MVARLFAHHVATDLGRAAQAGWVHGRHCERGVPPEQVRKPGRRCYVIGIVGIVRYTESSFFVVARVPARATHMPLR